MNWPKLAIAAAAIGTSSFLVYDIALAIGGLLFIGANSELPLLVLQKDLAGIPFLFYALFTALPIAALLAAIFAIHLIAAGAIARSRMALALIPLSTSVIQIIVLIIAGVHIYDFDVKWIIQERAFGAIGLLCLGGFNSLMFCGWFFIYTR